MNTPLPPYARLDFQGFGRLDGRTALVTGAGNGIGRAIAHCFAQRGARVVCADLDAAAAKRTAGEITSAGGTAQARALDVSDEADAKRAVEEAAKLPGGLRILVNNAAAFYPISKVTEITDADWQKVLGVNLTAALHLCRAAIPLMKQAGGGSIINVASQLGSVAAPGRAMYATTKAALIHLSKSLALDHAADGIRVNSLSPGPVSSDRIIARYGSEAATDERFHAMIPLGRAGRPAEIARAALFLASDDASFVTGSDLLVDGGYTAH